MPVTIKDSLNWAASYLKKRGVKSNKLDSELILSRLIHQERVYLFAHPEEILDAKTLHIFKEMVKKRGKRLPLAYIIGEKEFFGRTFIVEKGVFCPRPETELLVEEVIKTFAHKDVVKIFEIGVGTGAISVTLACELSGLVSYCCDISEKAIRVTKKNIEKYNLQKKINLFQGHLLDAVKPLKFDAIISNPPYLSKKDYLEAEPDVRKEPKKALMAKAKGLSLIKKIICQSKDYLSKDGWLFIEIGDGQGGDVLRYAEKKGFKGEIIKDLADKERLFKGKLT